MLDDEFKNIGINKSDEGEDWLVTYSDMITLLFAFFVLLFAISQVDERKFSRIAQSIVESVSDKTYSVPDESIPDIYYSLQKIIKEEQLQGIAEANYGPEGVIIRFKGSILFPTASSELTATANRIFERLAVAIKDQPYRFDVEGHTDDRLIHTAQYPSNWELSSARASTVVRFLISEDVHPGKLRVLGFADTKPLKPNRDDQGNIIPENQEYNRRVDIVFKPIE